MSEQKYKQAARIIQKIGFLPFPINETFMDIIKTLVNEDELDFVLAFRRNASQTMEQLLKSTKGAMNEEEIERKANSLAKKGIIFNQPNSQGVMVYRLLPLIMVGVFEYVFMKKIEFTEKEKKLAELFHKLLFIDFKDLVQKEYDTIVPFFKTLKPFDRTIPILDKNVSGKEVDIVVDEDVEVGQEKIITAQNVEELIEKFDDITVAHCFCRQHQDLLGNPCKFDAPRENCFTFGKSARHVANHGFGRKVSKEEALKIMKEAEDYGLVHKAFHTHSDISKIETSVCNCCQDCCGTFLMYRQGLMATINASDYLSNVNEELCNGCGICVEKCPLDVIELNDDNKAEVKKDYCIGCGLCAHFCPENAISLVEKQRTVYYPPPRIKN